MKNFGALLSFLPSDLVVVNIGGSSIDTHFCRNKLNDLNIEKKKTGIFRSFVIAVVVAIQGVAKFGFHCTYIYIYIYISVRVCVCMCVSVCK